MSSATEASGDLGSPLLDGEEIPDPTRKRLYCIDDMLRIYCGEFGAWQARHFVLTSLAWALEAFHTMVMIFADREPAWRCVAAAGSGCDPASSSVCGLEPGSWEWVGGPWSSTVAQWGLVCGDKYKVGLVQALFFFGCTIGAGIFGHLSDSSLGRKGSLVIVCILNTIFGLATAAAPSYPIYALLRLLTGFSTGGVGLCAFVLATEPVGPTKRGAAGMSTFYFFSTGIALLSGAAYLLSLSGATALSSWRALYVASSLPSLLFLLLVLLPFVSESPRWFLVRGRRREADAVMRSIAASNRRSLPGDASLTLDNDNDKNDAGVIIITGSLIDVVKSPVTRARLLLAVAINFLCSVVYYGLSLNVVNLKTNVYAGVALNAVAEMPAFAVTAVLLDRFGRRPLTVATMWFSGAFCLLGAVLSSGENSGAGAAAVLRTGCGVMGIFGMAGTYNLLFIYTAELFPTVVRNAALGCAAQAAQMGAILAPFVVVAGGAAPFAVFAACAFAGGAHAFYLPETLNRPLYDTMAGMEDGETIADDDDCSGTRRVPRDNDDNNDNGIHV